MQNRMSQQEQKAQNIIYFQQVSLRSPIKENIQQQQISQSQSITSRQFTTQQLHRLQQLQLQFNKFYALHIVIKDSFKFDDPTIDHLCKSIRDYVVYIVKYQHEQIFFQHAVQKKFIALLLEKIYHYKFLSKVIMKVFQSLEYLLAGMKKQDQSVYFMVTLNKEGFITTKYQFQQEDLSYYANFLKILVRKINKDEKYLNIFINQKQPHFPLLLNLLKLHKQKDTMLKTSVKLTLIQIASHKSKIIKSFTNNFPFVIFYPIYVYQIYHSFLDAISDDSYKQQIGKQNLKTTLKFMEDFIRQKDKQSIEMYANCFMSLIGKFIYKQFSQLNNKNPQKVIKILKILHDIVVHDITVLKIKIGMGQFFTKSIGKHLNKFLKSKTHHIDFSYWLIDECENDIREHCESIYMKVISDGNRTSSSVRSSFLRTVNSYIPRSRDNWLYHELKKISQLIGFQIELNKQINEQQYLQGSYLKAIQQDTKGIQVQNELYQKLIRNDNQQILFYYFKLVKQLKVPLKKQGIDIQEDNQSIFQLLGLLNSVTSLSVVKSFYSLVLQSEIYINQNKSTKIKHIYQHVLERLIYFILTEGWATFINRSKISLKQHENQTFSPDIFRDIQCDIIFFTALRHILGTKNNLCAKDNKQFGTRDIRRTQTKANCLFVRECEDNTLIEEPVQIILDGQYIKLIDEETKSISSEDILINRSFIYESQQNNCLQIVQKEKNQSPSQQYYCVSFIQMPIKNYIWNEIKWRKQIVMDLQLKLRLMMFQFVQ